jgi:hypothetical protein
MGIEASVSCGWRLDGLLPQELAGMAGSQAQPHSIGPSPDAAADREHGQA